MAPDLITLDYSALVTAGQTVTSLTLGIAADDFQFPVFGNPFTATVDGVVNAVIGSELESLDESGPVVHFFTVGLDPTIDNATHRLTLSIDEGGDGGDGYTIDFLTVGVTTVAATPETSTLLLAGGAMLSVLLLRRRR